MNATNGRIERFSRRRLYLIFTLVLLASLSLSCANTSSPVELCWENTTVAFSTPIEEPQSSGDTISVRLRHNISVQGQFPKHALVVLYVGGVRTKARVAPTSNQPYCPESGECWFQIDPDTSYVVSFGPGTFDSRLRGVGDSLVELSEIRFEEEGQPSKVIGKASEFSIAPFGLP